MTPHYPDPITACVQFATISVSTRSKKFLTTIIGHCFLDNFSQTCLWNFMQSSLWNRLRPYKCLYPHTFQSSSNKQRSCSDHGNMDIAGSMEHVRDLIWWLCLSAVLRYVSIYHLSQLNCIKMQKSLQYVLCASEVSGKI